MVLFGYQLLKMVVIGVVNGKAILNYTIENGLLSNQTGKIKGDGELLWVSSYK